MPTEDEMTLDERRKYLKRMKLRYMKAKREERSVLLSEMEQVTGMHRKSLTRLLHAQSLERKKRQSPRCRSYGKAVEEVIVSVWESLDYICAERLTPSLLTMAQHLARFGAVKLTSEVEEQLQTISRATVSRVLRAYRSRRRRLPQKGAERANQVTKGVPMGRLAWDITEPGHFEVDLVYHSGESTIGEHGHTIQMVDVSTGWSERVAVLGRGQRAMQAGFEHVLSRLPFAVVELHPDNGSEFFNYHLVRYWKEKVVGVQLSRSRPYQKNDNRIVEQKNDTLVRQYFGDLRFDCPEQIEAMNALYEQMWIYYNLFQPVMHLIEKTAVGDKVRRTWDQARTPFERLKATGKLSPEQEQRLQRLYEQTNPRHLREEIYQGLAQLWSQSMTSATSVA
jgi:hypothetical protein